MSKLKTNLDKALERDAEDLGKGMKALAGNAASDPDYSDEPPRRGPRNTAVSFTQEEYDFIKEVFETKGRGMKVATGIKMAALYVAERLESGHITMSRAGISERR
jgi:hypothetical protein